MAEQSSGSGATPWLAFIVGGLVVVAVIIGWGDGPTSPADLNSDGIVNAIDLALVLGGYGECR